jgi:hypothetical protein
MVAVYSFYADAHPHVVQLRQYASGLPTEHTRSEIELYLLFPSSIQQDSTKQVSLGPATPVFGTVAGLLSGDGDGC